MLPTTVSRLIRLSLVVGTALLVAGCVGNKSPASSAVVTPVQNTLTLTVDTGPAGSTGQINHAYVSVTVCVPGSQSQCMTIDHVLLDTASTGLRLVSTVIGTTLALPTASDSQGRALYECVTFGGGQTWGPVLHADVKLAGETAADLPIQLMDDAATGAAPPSSCGANGTLINDVSGFGANGVLGVGVFAQDCGSACVSAATPLDVYFGCSSNAACVAVNAPASTQVANPITLFAADNNGLIVNLPNLQNANGDSSVQGQVVFGLGTQTDNALPITGLTVLGTDASGAFATAYNGSVTTQPGLIDSGADAILFDDSSIGTCASGAFIGYYCPATAPMNLSAVNTGIGTNNGTGAVAFAIADPNSFVAGASAFIDLGGGGGSNRFVWGMPFFYGRKVYVGIEQHSAGNVSGPFFAY